MPELRPQGLDAVTFSTNAHRYGSEVISGDRGAGRAAARLEEGWYQLDPITPHYIGQEEHRSLAMALDVGAAVCKAAIKIVPSERIDQLRIGMLVDSGHHFSLVKEGTELAASQFKTALDEISSHDLVIDKEFSTASIERLSLYLSARAGEVFCIVSRAEERCELGYDAKELRRSMIGGLIKESVEYILALKTLYQHTRGRRRQEMKGSLYELMEFTYSLAKWYRPEPLSSRLIRFALPRENRPKNDFDPRRAIDLVEVGATTNLVQLKTSNSIEHKYASDILVIRPEAAFAQVANNNGVARCFQQIVDKNAASHEVKKAWKFLDTYFDHAKQGWTR